MRLWGSSFEQEVQDAVTEVHRESRRLSRWEENRGLPRVEVAVAFLRFVAHAQAANKGWLTRPGVLKGDMPHRLQKPFRRFLETIGSDRVSPTMLTHLQQFLAEDHNLLSLTSSGRIIYYEMGCDLQKAWSRAYEKGPGNQWAIRLMHSLKKVDWGRWGVPFAIVVAAAVLANSFQSRPAPDGAMALSAAQSDSDLRIVDTIAIFWHTSEPYQKYVSFDVKFRNVGGQLAFLKRLHIDVPNLWEFEGLVYNRGGAFQNEPAESNYTYIVEFPALTKEEIPYVQIVNMSRVVKSNGFDRINITMKTDLPIHSQMYLIYLNFTYDETSRIVASPPIYISTKNLPRLESDIEYLGEKLCNSTLDRAWRDAFWRKNEENIEAVAHNIKLILETSKQKGIKDLEIQKLLSRAMESDVLCILSYKPLGNNFYGRISTPLFLYAGIALVLASVGLLGSRRPLIAEGREFTNSYLRHMSILIGTVAIGYLIYQVSLENQFFDGPPIPLLVFAGLGILSAMIWMWPYKDYIPQFFLVGAVDSIPIIVGLISASFIIIFLFVGVIAIGEIGERNQESTAFHSTYSLPDKARSSAIFDSINNTTTIHLALFDSDGKEMACNCSISFFARANSTGNWNIMGEYNPVEDAFHYTNISSMPYLGNFLAFTWEWNNSDWPICPEDQARGEFMIQVNPSFLHLAVSDFGNYYC